jgi:hypothetical protein
VFTIDLDAMLALGKVANKKPLCPDGKPLVIGRRWFAIVVGSGPGVRRRY